jgi:chitinase
MKMPSVGPFSGLCFMPGWLLLAGALLFLTFASRADLWRTGYYPGYEQASMPASNIDFTALTHIIHFSVVPNSNGTLNSSDNGITTANSTDIVTRAHAAGVKVLICVGGADSESDFQSACSTANLPTFINNLTNFMAARGYDGLDIDWEPFPSSDAPLYTNLVIGLRSALNQFAQPKYLTVAAGAYPPYGDSPTAEYMIYAAIQGKLDQINIMTYDLSGPYGGWVTWFNSPIYDGNFHFPGTDELVPSVNAAVTNFLGNGVAASKLAIGIAFYGYVWTGGTGVTLNGLTQPRQSWSNAPAITAYGYSDLIANNYQTNLYHWDTIAQAAYLSVTNAIATNDEFVSYDDVRTCQAKVSYARNNKLGGVMIWELAQDHQAGSPDPLLEAVKQSVASPGQITVQSSGNNFNLAFSGISLGSYAVQWTSNLAGGNWNTLALTNLSGLGGGIQVTDPGALTNQSVRFYRVLTPP